MQPIGLQHHAVRRARDLISNKIPNPRKMFVAEGLWAHRLLMDLDIGIDTFLWCPEASAASEVRTRAEALAAIAHNTYTISERTLAKISERTVPDGLISIAQLPTWELAAIPLADDSLVVVADAMEITGNLGTLLRAADAAGVDLVLLTNRRVRLTHPKVLRASQGAVLTVPTVELDEAAADAWLGQNGFDVLLADTAGASSYADLSYRGRRTAFVLGAEKYGLSKAWRATDHRRVRVPMLGRIDSLNVSISAAVLMFHAREQKDRR